MNTHDVLASIATRINALTGVTAANQEATFVVRPLTDAQFQSPVFTFSAVKRAQLMAEKTLSEAIANVKGHPWRQYFTDQTAPLANTAVLPAVSTNSKQIIGVWGSVFDSSDNNAVTEKSLATIRRRVRNANSFFKTEVYYFNITGERIYHTRDAVVISCCVYDDSARQTAMDSNGALQLPDVLEEALVCGAVSLLVRDDEFTGQAAIYRTYFNEILRAIGAGSTTVPSKQK